MRALDRVVDALQAHGCANKGNDWVCPSHADGDPSLSVNEGESGVVMRCHAGCTTEQVLSAIGLKMSDLFDTPASNGKQKLNIIAQYPYTSETGDLLYEVLRLDPKDFRQRVPLGGGKWKWSIKDVRRVPYRLPQVLAAIAAGETIYIVEGEKDVESIERAGGVATCNSGGAGKWRDEYAQFFKGARVVVIADNDDAGRKHAWHVAESLKGFAQSIQVSRPRGGKDMTDHLRGGWGFDELLLMGTDDASPITSPDETAPTARINPMDAIALSANAIDDLPRPSYIIDKYITSDSLNIIYGMPGVGKSFLALAWALCIAMGIKWSGHEVVRGSVLYVAAEGVTTVADRKLAWQKEHASLGIPEDAITWYPEPVNLLDPQQVADLLDFCDRHQFIAVFIDTLSRSMPGQDENAPGPMTTVIENLDAIRRATRAAVTMVHHTPKDGSTPRGHSSLMGAVWTAIKVSKGEDGDINVEVEKQKHDAPVSKVMRMRKVGDSVVLYEAEPFEKPDLSQSEVALLSVLADAAGSDGLPNRVFKDLSGLPETSFYRSKATLEAAGKIRNIGSGNRPIWVLG